MSRTRIVKGTYNKISNEDHNLYAKNNIVYSAAKEVTEKGEKEGVSYGEPSSAPSLGNLDLTKIVINTSCDVCHDEVEDFSDYKNFWILEDNGKYYHWLNNRTNADDKNKPDSLPITLASTDNFVLMATFKTKSPIQCKIRVKDSANKYIFKEEEHPEKSKDEEFEIAFVCDTKPYKDTVQYFENFTLNFEYSEDGKTWLPMKSVNFCLYLTWKTPDFYVFDRSNDQTETMQIKCKVNNNKDNICESLLWLGCKDYGNNVVSNEESLIDKIFAQFKTLKVLRRRETKWNNEGLGYWRNASMGQFVRGLRTLLKDGEARCGEWTDFFKHILLSQGILDGNDTLGICTEAGAKLGFQVNPTIPDSYSNITSLYKPKPISLQFAVKNAMHSNINNFNETVGDSPGQGNPKSQPLFIDHIWFYDTLRNRFYDASYGKTYSATDSNLKKYCNDNLNSMFMTDNFDGRNVVFPGVIIKTNLHNYIRATKNLF